MRIRAVRLLASVVCLVLLAGVLPQGQTVADPTVYVTKTGAKYHRDGCSSLSRSRIPMKLSVAAASYGACKNCRPPVPQSGAAVRPAVPIETPKTTAAPIRSGRCQATTKKGAQCKRKAQAGRAYCWQHG